MLIRHMIGPAMTPLPDGTPPKRFFIIAKTGLTQKNHIMPDVTGIRAQEDGNAIFIIKRS